MTNPLVEQIPDDPNWQPQLGHILPDPNRPHVVLPMGLALAPGAITYPAAADNLSRVGAFDWLGNDKVGDCVPAAHAHLQRIQKAFFTGSAERPTAAEVLSFYWSFINPDGVDRGSDSQVCLEQMMKHGLCGHTPVMFAKVPKTLDAVRAAIALFGGVYFSCNLQDPAHRYKSNMGTWSYMPGQPVYGSHGVVIGFYITSPADLMKFVTWAQVVGLDDSFFSHNIFDDFWLPIYPWAFEKLDRPSQEALAAEYLAITGKVLVLPPAPIPPAPPPVPYVGVPAMVYTPISNVRVLDTRTSTGLAGKFVSHQPRTIKIAGANGIPANATAIAANLTITTQTSPGYLAATPLPHDPPATSSLNAPVGDNRANCITGTGLAPDGSLAVEFIGQLPSDNCDVLIDVFGYFTP